jgi:hypothetical protein
MHGLVGALYIRAYKVIRGCISFSLSLYIYICIYPYVGMVRFHRSVDELKCFVRVTAGGA